MTYKLFYLSFISLLMTSPAESYFLGFGSSPCPTPEMIYNAKNHMCYYCPRGTFPLEKGEENKDHKACEGIPYLGVMCPVGNGVTYDANNNVCILCERGYTFSFDRKRCIQY